MPTDVTLMDNVVEDETTEIQNRNQPIPPPPSTINNPTECVEQE